MPAASPASISIQGRRLEYQLIPAVREGTPVLVFLHEGLGSISLWRDFPQRVAEATGCAALVYSRYGYGQSEVLESPRDVEYLHREALDALPELLARLGIAAPVLVGHSDGASIALIHAGSHPAVRGVVVMAPHVFVEKVSTDGIAETTKAFETTDLPQKLGRHHADAAKTFYGWSDIWRHPDFRTWNIEDCLPSIRCPVLAIQGVDDEYGTMAHLDSIAARAGGPVELLKLPACGHSPQRDQPDSVTAAIARFVASLD